jgi:hypothetical protein
MPSQPVQSFADQLLQALRKELEKPAAVQARSREVLAALLLESHGGTIEIPMEALRQLPAGLKFNLTVTDDAAYRLQVVTEDGQPFTGAGVEAAPIDGRRDTGDALNDWAGVGAQR